MNPSVSRLTPSADYKLLIEFENGERKLFDVTPYLDKGVFKRLRDESRFKLARIVAGTVEWPGEIDLCPDTLYEKSQPIQDEIQA